jgi:hypothetical protein
VKKKGTMRLLLCTKLWWSGKGREASLSSSLSLQLLLLSLLLPLAGG